MAPSNFEIYEATECERMAAVWKLAYDTYRAKDYCDSDKRGTLRHYRCLDCMEETKVFCLGREGVLEGTISVTVDGPRGLHTDFAFPLETTNVREECKANGWKLASCWRIATLPENRGQAGVLMALIGRTIEYGIEIGIQEALFTFNPRHEKIYKHLVGLWKIAGPRSDKSVHAPAVLMRGNWKRIKEYWDRRKQ